MPPSARCFKLVTFDVTNTLLKFRASVGHEYGRMAESYGIQTKQDSLTRSFNAQWKLLNRMHPNFGVDSGLSSEQWWFEIVKRTFQDAGYAGIDPEHLRLISARLYKRYETKDCWEVFPGVVEVLQHLAENGVCVGVISNFDERLPRILADLGLRPYFQFVLSSYLVRHQKPNPEIFHLALKKARCRVTADQAVHVGDQVELDYLAARNAGWNALLVLRDANSQPLDKVDREDIIDNVADVKRFF